CRQTKRSSCWTSTVRILRINNLLLQVWSAYSSPVPKNLKQLVTLISLCTLLSLSGAFLFFIWLYNSLQYTFYPSAILSTASAIVTLITLVLLHPIRCILTIIIPTIGTKQGRKLLLSSCFMAVAFNIIPNIVTNTRTIFQMIRCISRHSANRIINSTYYFEVVTEDVSKVFITQVINSAREINFGKVNIFAQSETSLVERQLLKTTEKIKHEFLSIELLLKDGILTTNRVLAIFFIAFLLFNGSWYLKKYLTDIKFDNSYITNKLEKVVLEKKASDILTFSTKYLIRSTGLKLSKRELWICLFRIVILSLFLLPTALIIASDHITFQFAMAVGNWIDTLPDIPLTLQINYRGTLKICGVLKSSISHNKEYPWHMTIVSSNCKTQASSPNNSIIITVGLIYSLMYAMIFLEAYAQRLQRKISASFYERREDERVSYLFEKILKKHSANVSRTQET
ncbi:osteoclast stimulatory transmembrane protein, partial [Bombina bombina]|uniref:osteoclast stimulatory transmembrane protein n=1 Tax=Bombina bombina TaxID=8345 RepID=UPI00235AEEF8